MAQAIIHIALKHILYSIAGALGALFLWGVMFAQPLVVERLTFDKPEYHPGDRFRIVAIGKKPWWSARFCTATASYLHLQDVTSQIASVSQPVNYNPGNVKKVGIDGLVPRRFDDGEMIAWSRTVYRCFGLVSITVTNNHEVNAKAMVLGAKLNGNDERCPP